MSKKTHFYPTVLSNCLSAYKYSLSVVKALELSFRARSVVSLYLWPAGSLFVIEVHWNFFIIRYLLMYGLVSLYPCQNIWAEQEFRNGKNCAFKIALTKSLFVGFALSLNA